MSATNLTLTGSFITINDNDKLSSQSSIQQLVDIVQSDIASINSTTRKSYEVFTSGSLDSESIVSSLYQTVYDQDFTLGTSNPLFDITMGSYKEEVLDTDTGNVIVKLNQITPAPTYDAGGKLIGFGSTATMMREKVNIYRQFAQNLLGDPNAAFVAPHGEIPVDDSIPANVLASDPKKINAAIFICFRRLFTRDNIYKGTFGIKVHKNASLLLQDFVNADDRTHGGSITNINIAADTNVNDNNTPVIYDDSSATSHISVSPVSGEVSTIIDNSQNPIGLIYYDSGIIILDVERAFNPDQIIRGLIDSIRKGASLNTVANGPFYVYGTGSEGEGYYSNLYTTDDPDSMTEISVTPKDPSGVDGDATNFYYAGADPSGIFSSDTRPANIPLWIGSTNNDYYSSDIVTEIDGKSLLNDKLYPGLWVSGTIDTVLDHFCTTRFGRGNLSAMSFRNETVINSSLIFCRAAPGQLNYSTNPTYKDSDGNIIAKNNNEPFSFVTTIGLFDAQRSLLAVAKTSRPIEKNPETDLSIRIRLDY